MSKWAREEYMLLAQPTELSLWKAVRWKQSFAFKLCSSSFSFSESSEKCDLSGAGKGSGEARGTGKIGTIVDFKIRTLLDFRQELFVGLQAAPISGPPLQLVGIVIFRFSQEFLLWTLGSSPNYIITLLKLFAWLTDLSAPFVCGTWNGAQVGQVSACVRCMFRIKTLCPPVFCMFMTLKLFCALRFLFDLANNILWY